MEKKLVFTRKPHNGFLYKWSPGKNEVNKTSNKKISSPIGCTAIANSQGQDYNTTYVYDSEIINGEEHKFAYVECGYVE